MSLILTPCEARVLGCLIEKERTTPEYYPLTLNSLTTACNQKSSRDPVMDLDEGEVEQAIEGLREKGVAFRVDTAGSRVAKFRHALQRVVDCTRDEQALLCVLLLRGPQTAGELRSRCDRLHAFASIDAVYDTLRALAEDYAFPLVQCLPRQPGRKEPRWCHLLCGEPDLSCEADCCHEVSNPFPPLSPATQGAAPDDSHAVKLVALQQRIDELTATVVALDERLRTLEQLLN